MKEWTEEEKQKARNAIKEYHGNIFSVKAKLKSELGLTEWQVNDLLEAIGAELNNK